MSAQQQKPAGSETAVRADKRSIVSQNGSAAAQVNDRNRLLRALSPGEYARLLPDLELIDVPSGHMLFVAGAPIDHVYFPQTAVASMVRRMSGGSGVEVGTIGCDGIVGGSVTQVARAMPTECVVQIAGTLRRMPAPVLLDAMTSCTNPSDGASLADLLNRYSQALFEQVAQSAACNRMHPLEQRCARWLLMTHDRVDGDELNLTQEFLSYMLGVRRAGVTEACGALQRAGLISYRRGRITVTDLKGLERVACECFRVGVEAYDALLGPLLRHDSRQAAAS